MLHVLNRAALRCLLNETNFSSHDAKSARHGAYAHSLLPALILNRNFAFYIHGSVHRESNLMTVQQDSAYSVYYFSVGSSTCFGC